jgi:glycosyltransferase involved in cell wall biosynthesis
MQPSSLRLSVITPCLNRAKYVEQAIQSVLDQNYPNFEHIVVDGGSTDGTLEILVRYPHLKVLTGKDRGMYDALNKGLEVASGEVIGFLNSDDLYVSDVLGGIVQQVQDPALDAVAGQALFFNVSEQGEQIEIQRLSSSHPEGLYRQIILSGCLMNAWLFRRRVFHNVGTFDPVFKISGDADFMLRLGTRGFKYNLVDLVIYRYRSHEDSLTMALTERKLKQILEDSCLLADKYRGKDSAPEEVQSFLGINCAAVGRLLANKYLEKKKFDEILKLGETLARYDPTWTRKYVQEHRKNWPVWKRISRK